MFLEEISFKNFFCFFAFRCIWPPQLAIPITIYEEKHDTQTICQGKKLSKTNVFDGCRRIFSSQQLVKHCKIQCFRKTKNINKPLVFEGILYCDVSMVHTRFDGISRRFVPFPDCFIDALIRFH